MLKMKFQIKNLKILTMLQCSNVGVLLFILALDVVMQLADLSVVEEDGMMVKELEGAGEGRIRVVVREE